MKNFLPVFALSAFALAGCNAPEQNTPPNAANTSSNAAAPAKQLRIALLTPGDINDQGWNQLAYEGLQAVEKESGAKTAHQVTKSAADQQPALRDFADDGYDLILCHGFEYGDRVKTIAPTYPKTKFVVVGGNVKQSPNVATLVPKLEDATYLLGMVAGGLSKTGTVGLIGGMKLPVIASTFQAFELGAHAVNPKIKVLTNYVGDFENQNAAKEAAKGMIAQGADVLFHNADQAGKGMFNAAQEAKIICFGSNRNQNSVAPDVCLASAVIEMPRAFQDVVKSVQDNTFKPEFIELNLAHKTIAVEWNDKLKAKIPAALMQKVMAAQKQIERGALKIKRNV
jgi:basic membrane lipoprotein Med (substrate-binding protein (PBP1-ABC) superfamily)